MGQRFAFTIILLGAAGAGLYVFQNSTVLIVAWLVILMLAVPLLIGFTLRADDLSGKDLVTIYRTGAKSLPVIGKLLFGSSSESDNDSDKAEKATESG